MAGQIISRGNGTWLVRVFLGRDPLTGKREYDNKTVHGNKKEAEQRLTEMLRDRDQGKVAIGAKKRVIDVLLDDLLQDYRINGKRIDWAEMVVEKHLRDAFGKIPIAKLTTDHLNGYVTERKAEGITNATINRELALLRRAFNLGRLTTPPKVARMPRFQLLKENNVRKGFFEHDAYIKLRHELPAELRPVLTFAYYTGCRRGEVLSLQWSQIDLDARMVASSRARRRTTKRATFRYL